MKLKDETIYEILKSISNHLASRPECRSVEYQVMITDNYVNIHPNILVFPDIHRRKETDKEPLVYHIFKYHFPELIDARNIETTFFINNTTSVKMKSDIEAPGTMIYVYHLSIDSKRRKWIRVR